MSFPAETQGRRGTDKKAMATSPLRAAVSSCEKTQWPIKSLGDLVEIVMGQAPSSKDCNFEGSGTPFVKVGEFGSTRPTIREWTTNPLKLARSTDVLLCVVGATCGKINLGEECAIGRSVAAIRPKPDKLNQFYLYYFMMTLVEGLREGSLGAAQTVISKEMIATVRIPAPPLPEQDRIVGILDEAFDGIAKAKATAEANLQNARALFQSHLQSVFSQRGEGWVDRKLEEICIVDWGNTKLTKSSYVEGGEFLAVSAAGCDGRIGHKEHMRWTPVLSAIGAQCGRMFLPDEDFTAIKNTITLTPRPGVCTGKFLYRLLTHVELPKRGAAQPFISKGDIQEFTAFIPEDLKTQEKIEIQIEAFETETQRLESLYQNKLNALDELKKSLLHQAFTGNL
jgi:restriction endonuclease S subunit